MSEETPKEEIPIEQLSAYSLYLVQESLNEWEEQQGQRKGLNGWQAMDIPGVSLEQVRQYNIDEQARGKYKKGAGYSIQDEYRYLLAEKDFQADAGINSQAATDAAAEAAAAQAALEAEPNRIDQEYADGIGIVNQALEESTLADDVMGPPVDPTNIEVDAEPVSISNPENNAGKLGGINSFKKTYNKAEAAKLSSIKNKSINI